MLTTGCVTLGLMLGVLIGGALAPPVASEPWLKTYGSLVGAAVGAIVSIGAAIAAAAVAIRNVLRQMRINLLIREEDRMEALIPGLIDAANFLKRLEGPLEVSPWKTQEILEDEGFKGDIAVAMRQRLVTTDWVVQRRVSTLLETVRFEAELLETLYGKGRGRPKRHTAACSDCPHP